MRIAYPGIVVLAAVWLATLATGYYLGTERRPGSPPLADDSGSDLPPSVGSAESQVPRDFNETRRLGTQSRFLTFTQTLGGDELARILPEITDKMSLDQVQPRLRRLFEEVPPGPGRRIARFELIRRWAQLEPEAVLGHTEGLDDPKMRHDLRLKAIEGWASVDPRAALEFALESEDEVVTKSKKAVRDGFASTRELDTAFAFVSLLAEEETPDKGWTVTKAVESLFENDDLAVINWVEKLEPGPVRDQAIVGMLGQWAAYDPEAAADWIEEQVAPEKLGEARAVIQVITGTR